jgi:hypothetical protein
MLVGCKMQPVLLLSVQLLLASLSVAEERAAKYTPPSHKSDAGAPKRVFDFSLTADMKTADLDEPKSAVNKLIGYVVKGPAKPSAYLAILHPSPTKIQLAIRDDSIFIPGGKAADAQRGFR